MSQAFISQSKFNFRTVSILVLVAAIASLSFVFAFSTRAQAAPDTCTWTGNISNDMNDANNWTGCDNAGVPESGDSYIFPQSASNKALNIDSFAVNPLSMNFTGTGYSVNRTGSEVLEFIGSGVAISVEENATFNVPIVIGNGSLQNSTLRAANDTSLTLNGAVEFNTGIGEINVGSSGFEGGVFFNAAITGSTSQFIAQNSGYAEITGSGNTYTATTVGAESAGNFRCVSISCFGNSANDIYAGGGAVALLVGGTFSNDIVTSAPNAYISSVEAFEDVTLTGDITLSMDLRIVVATTDVVTITVEPTAAVNIQADTILALLGPSAETATIDLQATVQGSGDGVVVNGVTAILSGANTFDTGVGVGSSGVLIARGTDSALGDPTFSSSVSDGGVIQIDQMGVSATLPWPLVLSGDGPDGQGALILNSDTDVTYTGDIILVDPVTISNNGGGTSVLTLNGEISGTGDLTLTSDGAGGRIRMAGSQTNTYDGDTNLIGTRLDLAKTGGLAITGDINVISTSLEDALLIVGANGGNQIANDAIVNLDQDPSTNVYLGVFDPAETIGSLTGNGNFLSNGAGQGVTIGGGDKSGTFTGLLTNSSATSLITKIGTGTWTLTDATYAGVAGFEPSIVVEGGSVVLGSNLPGVDVTVATGSTLKGTGSIGSTEIESGGTLSTGNSPGCLTLEDLTLESGSVFTQEIEGSTACSGYDQTTVAGPLDLGGATLDLSVSYNPAAGTVFTIISAESVTGTFNGLADGSRFSVDGKIFRINYTSTTVTLTEDQGSGALPDTGTNTTNYVLVALTLIAAGLVLARRSNRFSFTN